MSRDQIYAEGEPPSGPFEFSEEVARVFPDMLRRSIPGYAATIQAIRSLARNHVVAGTQLYDLGCSLGASTRAMRQGVRVPGCRIVAIDNAPAMVRRCREILAEDDDETPVDVQCSDIRDLRIENASMVVMNYTLQFIAPEDRPGMLRKIADGMIQGGVLVLSEKVVHSDPAIESSLQTLHTEFKRRHQYSERESARKRAALENVLVPDTVEAHEARLKAAGFAHVGVWLRYFNFVSMIAFR
jgi:tRNA (cmo5U34)-methyltransferase